MMIDIVIICAHICNWDGQNNPFIIPFYNLITGILVQPRQHVTRSVQLLYYHLYTIYIPRRRGVWYCYRYHISHYTRYIRNHARIPHGAMYLYIYTPVQQQPNNSLFTFPLYLYISYISIPCSTGRTHHTTRTGRTGRTGRTWTTNAPTHRYTAPRRANVPLQPDTCRRVPILWRYVAVSGWSLLPFTTFPQPLVKFFTPQWEVSLFSRSWFI